MELLRTPRVLLRQWSDADVGAFFDIYSRDEVARWLGPQPRRAVGSREDAAVRLRGWCEYGAGLSAPYGLWAIAPLGDGETPIGTALLLPLRDADGPTGDVEIGWHLHPDQQGKGIATEAAAALLDRAAGVGIAEVLALTDLDNAPSQAVAARLGMVDEGETDRWLGLTTRQFRKHLKADS